MKTHGHLTLAEGHGTGVAKRSRRTRFQTSKLPLKFTQGRPAHGGGSVLNPTRTAPQVYRTVWLSDIHLGFRGCSAASLLAFLRSVECEFLYLVGDIIDIWSVRKRPFWPQDHNNVLRTILGKAKYGTKVIYVPGNHDEMLWDYNGMAFGNIQIIDRIVHRKADGKRFLVIHGDQFDSVVRSSRAIALLGSHAYPAARGGSTWSAVSLDCPTGPWPAPSSTRSRTPCATSATSRRRWRSRLLDWGWTGSSAVTLQMIERHHLLQLRRLGGEQQRAGGAQRRQAGTCWSNNGGGERHADSPKACRGGFNPPVPTRKQPAHESTQPVLSFRNSGSQCAVATGDDGGAGTL